MHAEALRPAARYRSRPREAQPRSLRHPAFSFAPSAACVYKPGHDHRPERKDLHAPFQTPARRNARDLLRARRFQACRRLLPGEVRRHACAVHGEPGGKGAGLDAQFRQGLGDGRIRHAAALHRRAHAPRGRGRQAGRPHAGDPAADRPQSCAPSSICRRSASSRSPSTATCIQADGGTRTASITGGWIALHDCLRWMESAADGQACRRC